MTSAPQQRFVTSQRVRISYWDWGNEDAPNLVLVHGGGDHSRSWDRIASALRDEYHVVALDLRGHGDSDPTPGGHYGLPDNALDVVRVIETVGAPSRVLATPMAVRCHSSPPGRTRRSSRRSSSSKGHTP